MNRSNSSESVRFTTLDHIRSTWNQIKFGWALALWPKFEQKETIYLLGRRYHKTLADNNSTHDQAIVNGTFFDFTNDFNSRLWFTYREDFDPLLKNISTSNEILTREEESTFVHALPTCINERSECKKTTGLIKRVEHKILNKRKLSSVQNNILNQRIPMSVQTSDCGWGCMYRSGQMLLGQALVVHFLGRGWRLDMQNNTQFHQRIIQWFNDSWNKSSPLSLHRLVKASGQKPGEWCGPGTVCTAVVRTMAEASFLIPDLSQLRVYLARDRVIYREEIVNLSKGLPTRSSIQPKLHFTDHTANYCSQSTINDIWVAKPSATILLIPLMLGTGSRINNTYITLVLHLFHDPAFIGLIGGRTKHSTYFVGCQKDQLIYLDPHLNQPAIKLDGLEKFPTDSWHCPIPKLMKITKLDPSCAIGFYCRDRGELSDLLDRLPSLMTIHNNNNSNESTRSYSAAQNSAASIVEVLTYEKDLNTHL